MKINYSLTKNEVLSNNKNKKIKKETFKIILSLTLGQFYQPIVTTSYRYAKRKEWKDVVQELTRLKIAGGSWVYRSI